MLPPPPRDLQRERETMLSVKNYFLFPFFLLALCYASGPLRQPDLIPEQVCDILAAIEPLQGAILRSNTGLIAQSKDQDCLVALINFLKDRSKRAALLQVIPDLTLSKALGLIRQYLVDVNNLPFLGKPLPTTQYLEGEVRRMVRESPYPLLIPIFTEEGKYGQDHESQIPNQIQVSISPSTALNYVFDAKAFLPADKPSQTYSLEDKRVWLGAYVWQDYASYWYSQNGDSTWAKRILPDQKAQEPHLIGSHLDVLKRAWIKQIKAAMTVFTDPLVKPLFKHFTPTFLVPSTSKKVADEKKGGGDDEKRDIRDEKKDAIDEKVSRNFTQTSKILCSLLVRDNGAVDDKNAQDILEELQERYDASIGYQNIFEGIKAALGVIHEWMRLKDMYVPSPNYLHYAQVYQRHPSPAVVDQKVFKEALKDAVSPVKSNPTALLFHIIDGKSAEEEKNTFPAQLIFTDETNAAETRGLMYVLVQKWQLSPSDTFVLYVMEEWVAREEKSGKKLLEAKNTKKVHTGIKPKITKAKPGKPQKESGSKAIQPTSSAPNDEPKDTKNALPLKKPKKDAKGLFSGGSFVFALLAALGLMVLALIVLTAVRSRKSSDRR